MKSFLTSLFVCCCISLSIGQGNLQFDHVLYIRPTLSNFGGQSTPEVSTTLTIPTGKVWKLETAWVNRSTSVSTGKVTEGTMYIDGVSIFDRVTSGATSMVASNTSLPMWLGPGTYTLTLKGECTSCPSSYIYTGLVTGIEFNVIP